MTSELVWKVTGYLYARVRQFTLNRCISEAVEAVAESSDAITQPAVFDVHRSLLK